MNALDSNKFEKHRAEAREKWGNTDAYKEHSVIKTGRCVSMKRMIAFVLISALVVALAGCGAKQSKKDVFKLVEKNYDAILTACENRDKEALLAISGITNVSLTGGYVLVYCKGSGIAPSSQDYGFYYTEENLPVAVDCNMSILCDTDDLTPEGEGYQYIDNHNVFYTEQIKGNIYFYSTAY